MPTIEENRKYWNRDYSWESRGDEWSKDWGAVSMQWYGTILPRIHSFLPVGTIVEIGCGHGRWTQYLKDWCARLIAVDLSEKCVGACQRRFEASIHVSFHCNNGTSLDMVEDDSVDFVFSYDALPMVDRSTMEAYVAQLPRLLRADGVAFLHHSNLGAYESLYQLIRKMPNLEGFLQRLGLPERELYWRDPSVSAQLVERFAAAHGLRCISQELFRWGTRRLFIDSFSILVKNTSEWSGDCLRLKNKWFDREATNLSQLARLYVRRQDGTQ